MTEWKTIRVPKEDYEDAKTRKEEHGVTWGDYVSPHRWHSVFDEPQSMPDGEIEQVTESDFDEIHRKLDQIQGAQGDTVSEAIQLADVELHELEREIKKAQELAEQARDNTEELTEGMKR